MSSARSDEGLRRLERRWRESESLEDEIALLNEKLRLGDIRPERVELAAYLGHPAAELCLAWDGDSAWGDGQRLRGVSRFDKESRVRIAIAGATSSLTRDQKIVWRVEDPEGWRALYAAEDWVDCPCAAHREAAGLAAAADPRGVGGAAARAAWRRPTQGARAALVGGVEAEVLAEVVPWALGYGDPVALRIDRRRRAAPIGLDELRSAERRARGADAGAQEDYLQLRLESGTTTRQELELAAYCGSEGAARIVNLPPIPPDPRAWIAGLERWGVGPYVQAAHALQREHGGQPAAKHALEAWLEGTASRELLFQASRAARNRSSWPEVGGPGVVSALAAFVGFRATASRRRIERSQWEFGILIRYLTEELEGERPTLASLISQVKGAILERALRLPSAPQVGPRQLPAWLREGS